MVTKVTFHRFKQFRDQTFELHPGVSLLGGGNNSGKSTLLHGLAVWEFCRTATNGGRVTHSLRAAAAKVLGWATTSFRPSASVTQAPLDKPEATEGR